MSRIFHKIILLILLCLGVVWANASIKRTENLSSRDGLFGDTVHKVYRDSRGYLWAIGVNGVSRYDGFHFENFTDQNTNKNYVNANFLRAVNEDATGTIWVGGNRGVHYFNPNLNAFVQVGEGDIRNVSFIGNYNDSNVWVSCYGGKNYLIDIYSHEAVPADEKFVIVASAKDNFGKEWFITFGGKILSDYDKIYKDLKLELSDMCFSPKGNLFLGSSRGVVYFSAEEFNGDGRGRLIPAISDGMHLTSAYVFALGFYENSIWAGTRNGLNQLVLNEQGMPVKVVHHYNQPDDNFSLTSNRVNDILLDNEGVLWIATHGGLSKVDPDKMWFYSFQKNPAVQNSIHENIIHPISGDSKGNVWFGSYTSGVSLYNTHSKVFTHFHQGNSELSGNYTRYMYTDLEDVVWISTRNRLLNCKNGKPLTVEVLDRKGKHFSFSDFSTIVQHPDKSYWAGIDRKIYKLRKVAPNVMKIERVLDHSAFPTIRLFVDGLQRIWAVGDRGILLIDAKTNAVICAYNKSNQPAFKSNIIQSICADTRGNVWLGSVNGLFRAQNDSLFQNHPEQVKLKGFFEDSGLAHSYITGLLPGNDGEVWLSTWKSIVKYNPKNIRLCRFVPYSYVDGLVSEKFNRHGAWRDTISNTYYFGGIDGVNYFSPPKSKVNKDCPEVIFNQVLVDGDNLEFLKETERSGKGTEVVARIKRIGTIKQLSVSFGSSSLLLPEQQVYAWRLVGRDDRLTYSREREFVLKDIKPGKYMLKVRSSSRQGKICPPKGIEIEVVSPWYWPLLIVLPLLVFVLAFVVYKRRKKAKAKTVKYVHSKLSEDKSEELEKQLHEIMRTQKPYLDPAFNATQLAELMGISSVKLSQLLNNSLQMKFYEYVNKQRVNEFIHRLENKENENLTLMGLAETCGFSSKSTFYRAFDREKGMTPAQFAKTLG